MIFSFGNSQVSQAARRRSAGHFTSAAISCLLLLLCTTLLLPPSHAAGSSWRGGRRTRTPLREVLQRMGGRDSSSLSPPRDTAEAAAPEPRRSVSLTELEGQLLTLDEILAEAEGPLASPRQEIEKLLGGELFQPVAGDAAPKDALPAEYSKVLLLRYGTVAKGQDFLFLRRKQYLGPMYGGIWHIVTVDHSTHMLRFPCIRSPEKLPTEQVVLQLAELFKAATSLVSRLPRQTAERLTAKGVAVPLRWGVVPGLPQFFYPDGWTCERNALLYDALQFNLRRVLQQVNFREEVKLYLMHQMLEAVNALHEEKLVHGSLTLKSFWLDSSGKLYLLLEDGLSDVNKKSTAAMDHPGAEQPSASGTPVPGEPTTGDTEVLTPDPPRPPRIRRPVSERGGSSPKALVEGSTQSTGLEESFSDARTRDAQELGLALYELWCKVTWPHAGWTTRDGKRRRPLSFDGCSTPVPQAVRSVVKALANQGPSTPYFVGEALKSELFMKAGAAGATGGQ